jgi:hypothetical protein
MKTRAVAVRHLKPGMILVSTGAVVERVTFGPVVNYKKMHVKLVGEDGARVWNGATKIQVVEPEANS